MVKDYLHNSFKHGIEAGELQFGVGMETTSPDVAEVLATTPGMGGVFLGPIDLAVDMGYGLNIFHPDVDLGVSFPAVGGDTGFLVEAADRTLSTYKKAVGK